MISPYKHILWPDAGVDAAGEVVAVGAGVDSFAVGDKVIGHLQPKVRTHGRLWSLHLTSFSGFGSVFAPYMFSRLLTPSTMIENNLAAGKEGCMCARCSCREEVG